MHSKARLCIRGVARIAHAYRRVLSLTPALPTWSARAHMHCCTNYSRQEPLQTPTWSPATHVPPLSRKKVFILSLPHSYI